MFGTHLQLRSRIWNSEMLVRKASPTILQGINWTHTINAFAIRCMHGHAVQQNKKQIKKKPFSTKIMHESGGRVSSAPSCRSSHGMAANHFKPVEQHWACPNIKLQGQ